MEHVTHWPLGKGMCKSCCKNFAEDFECEDFHPVPERKGSSAQRAARDSDEKDLRLHSWEEGDNKQVREKV